ncbi:MAG: 1-(5-phosphoribosyl)-5-[(5-phosphoribosylamino)methylideneamino]imidazole-4-carboxamide isomerase [Alphaproteobacteria bacterium]
MILYPAIDLKNGACVRLLRGDPDQTTVFSTDPADQARRFAAAGCEWLHVVDLDGAFAGRPANLNAIRAIVEAVDRPIQLGGGLRTPEAISACLDAGVARVVLGTAAVKDPALVLDACRRHPGRIAMGIDARDGRVAVEGWTETTTTTAPELARRFEDAGVAAIVHTDIDRDGTGAGINVDATAALARSVSTPVIASGGVGSRGDLARLKAEQPSGITGVIIGRALYDGRIDLHDALSFLRDDDAEDSRDTLS